MPAFWGQPLMPHVYPYYWFILEKDKTKLKLQISSKYCWRYRVHTIPSTGGHMDTPTDRPTKLCPVAINLDIFFLCGHRVLCGCLCRSRSTKRCLVASFVHKFGCIFSYAAISSVWLYIKQNSYKMTNCTKNKSQKWCFVGTDGRMDGQMHRPMDKVKLVYPPFNFLDAGV